MISVVIPLYNKAGFIVGTLNSALAQTPSPTEIIVVDDGSTDGGAEQVRAMNDERIILVSTPSPASGPSVARNVGVAAARGEWVSFLDADDLWLPGYLAGMTELIRDAPADVHCVFGGWRSVRLGRGSKLNEFARRNRGAGAMDLTAFLDAWLLDRSCSICSSAVTIRKQALLAVGGFPERYRRGEDKHTWLRVMAAGRAYYDTTALAQYNLETENQLTARLPEGAHPLCELIVQLLPTVDDRTRALLKRLYNHEVLQYALQLKQTRRVPPTMYAGYFRELDPLGYALLSLLSTTPASMQRGARELMLGARKLWRATPRKLLGWSPSQPRSQPDRAA